MYCVFKQSVPRCQIYEGVELQEKMVVHPIVCISAKISSLLLIVLWVFIPPFSVIHIEIGE